MRVLVRYDAMRAAITECRRVDEIKLIREKAAQISAAARVAKDREMLEAVTEIQVRAERRLGELLREMPKNAGTAGLGRSAKELPKDAPPTLAALGIDRKLSSRAQRLAEIPAEQFEARLSGKEKTIKLAPVGPTLDRVLSPLTKAGSAFAKVTREEKASDLVAGLVARHRKGIGVDVEFLDELLRMRAWIDELIRGVKPLVVSCGPKPRAQRSR